MRLIDNIIISHVHPGGENEAPVTVLRTVLRKILIIVLGRKLLVCFAFSW